MDDISLDNIPAWMADEFHQQTQLMREMAELLKSIDDKLTPPKLDPRQELMQNVRTAIVRIAELQEESPDTVLYIDCALEYAEMIGLPSLLTRIPADCIKEQPTAVKCNKDRCFEFVANTSLGAIYKPTEDTVPDEL